MKIRLAVRDWDFLVPLALGDLRPDGFELAIDRVAALPEDLGSDPRYDAGEVSFSRYVRGRAEGDRSIVGVPHFLMRGFRHRCIVTARDSGLTALADLRGKRIGLGGWPDSGHTWTRAALRRAGVGIEDATWYAERPGGFARPGRIAPLPAGRALTDLVVAGALDAAFLPFTPPGLFDPGSPIRPLLPDFREAERQYAEAVGYVPGIHILGVKPALAAAHPGLPRALSELLDRSRLMWLEKRARYADTTPWILDEIARVARDLPPGWDRNGLAANAAMIGDFAAELHAQGIVGRPLGPAEIFPEETLP